ncbi:hypothetical protein PAECIP111893_03606 [Paenibacillus plantiphilus]|uniref:Uncharacterized protein n=1 Tax=Paenibacillus plantiphilus TaxID=2905650 RepID=A0ABN8GTK7_9BACL|nr:hypothetical protein PAECIP111893_03606 [Paenibacillus plantiphilus]
MSGFYYGEAHRGLWASGGAVGWDCDVMRNMQSMQLLAVRFRTVCSCHVAGWLFSVCAGVGGDAVRVRCLLRRRYGGVFCDAA